MQIPFRPVLARTTVLLLLLGALPTELAATQPGSRLEGLVVDIDGRAATDYRMHLIDADGDDIRQAVTGPDGLYSFRDLPAGPYTIGVESPDGQVAPLNGPPIRLADGELARRDLKLLQSDAGEMGRAAGSNYGLGVWWGGLSTAAKVWTIIGGVVVVAIIVAALDDDDEPCASPPCP